MKIYFWLLLVCFFYGCSETIKECDKPPPVAPSPIDNGQKCICWYNNDNCFNRWGLYRYDNGDYYLGYFKNGQRNGDGILMRADNAIIHNYWKNNKNVGEEGREISGSMVKKYHPIKPKKATCENEQSKKILLLLYIVMIIKEPLLLDSKF